MRFFSSRCFRICFFPRKTLLAAEKSHAAHDEEVEKYENDLREVELLRQEYEDKLQDESQHTGRNLALEEDQVNEELIGEGGRDWRFVVFSDERISTIERRSGEENDSILRRI